jgi:hypothetical protein
MAEYLTDIVTRLVTRPERERRERLQENGLRLIEKPLSISRDGVFDPQTLFKEVLWVAERADVPSESGWSWPEILDFTETCFVLFDPWATKSSLLTRTFRLGKKLICLDGAVALGLYSEVNQEILRWIHRTHKITCIHFPGTRMWNDTQSGQIFMPTLRMSAKGGNWLPQTTSFEKLTPGDIIATLRLPESYDHSVPINGTSSFEGKGRVSRHLARAFAAQ